MIDTTILVARNAARQAALDAWLTTASRPAAVVAEGWEPLAVAEDIALACVNAGCVCCVGQMPFRVALVRLLRAARPRSLLILVQSADHLSRVRALAADGTLGVTLALH